MFTHISLLYWTRTSVKIPLRFLCWLCSSRIFQILRNTFAWILRRLSFIRFVFFFETSSYPSDFLYSVLSDRLSWVHFSLYELAILCFILCSTQGLQLWYQVESFVHYLFIYYQIAPGRCMLYDFYWSFRMVWRQTINLSMIMETSSIL